MNPDEKKIKEYQKLLEAFAKYWNEELGTAYDDPYYCIDSINIDNFLKQLKVESYETN